MKNKKETKTEKKTFWDFIKSKFANRTTALGLYVAITSVVFIAVVVLVNLIVTKADITGDLSSNKVYSITEDTEKFLGKLEEDINVYYVSDPQEINDNIYELVKKYEEKSKHVKVELKDPVLYPTFVEQYTDEEVQSNSIIVVNKNDKSKFKYVGYESLVQSELDYQTYTQEVTGIDVEGQLTSAINYVIAEASMKMYFLTGHEESENFDSNISDLISKQNIQTEVVNLETTEDIPSDCELLAIVSPKRDFSKDEVKKITAYIEAGNPVIMCLGYVDKNLPNVNKFLRSYGLENYGGLVIEKSTDNRLGQNFTYLFPDLQSHDITSSVENVYACLPMTTGLKEAEVVPQGITVEPLLKTSSRSYAITDLSLSVDKVNKNNSEKGPFYAGAIVTNSKVGENARLVVYASAAAFDQSEEIASDRYMNAELMMKTINYVANVDESTSISVPVKELSQTYLNIDGTQHYMWTLLLLIVIPILILVVGFFVWIYRRRK